MKTRCFVLAAITLCVFGGCATTHETTYSTVLEGMSRNNLRCYFGKPLRIETTAAGGEVWYYRFASWKIHPTSESGTREDFGEKTSYVSVGLSGSKEIEEHPVHISSDGFVVGPLPEGKVVKQ
jgi:outer membrane protein assembly factor BamE (lipoprotein component of BamABCDE complex)